MRRKLSLILVVNVMTMFFVACASRTESPTEDPAMNESMALMEEVNGLKAEAEAAGAPENFGKGGRAMSIYELGAIYYDKGMYTESLQPLAQSKTYSTKSKGT